MDFIGIFSKNQNSLEHVKFVRNQLGNFTRLLSSSGTIKNQFFVIFPLTSTTIGNNVYKRLNIYDKLLEWEVLHSNSIILFPFLINIDSHMLGLGLV